METKIIEIKKIAELNTSDWIVMPEEFSGLGYSLEISPGRISHSSAVEKVAKELDINCKNTSRDYLEREFVGNNSFYQFQKLEFGLGVKMPTIPEERKFIKLLDEGSKGNIDVWSVSGKKLKPDYLGSIKEDIVRVASPGRAEWLDADFKVEGEDLVVNYHVFEDGKIVLKSEILDKNTLMKDKLPGISLEKWLEESTEQGLPKNNVESGDLYYWCPEKDNE